MDIKFEKDGFKFKTRCSCIIKDKEHKKVILNKFGYTKDHDSFLLPGGGLEIFENTNEAINRELEEELGIKLECKLISIEENIVKDKNFHMIEFIFFAEIENFGFIKTLDNGNDKFEIIEINKIEKMDIRPKTLKKIIKQEEYKEINHNINYDWDELDN